MSDFERTLARWRDDPDIADCLVHERRDPARRGIFDELDPPLDPLIEDALAETGIERLYRHQVAFIGRARAGEHAAIVAGTASGKSLAYQLPVVEAVLADPNATALLLFPTKALGRDQLRGLGTFGVERLVAAAYDGDTPSEERRWIRKSANVVLTNPDMLHVGILPNHPGWDRVLAGLRFVVVDEMHTLRGAFGTHVALVLRRLRRLARARGADPTFLLTSATIGNPGDLAGALVGSDVHIVEQDTAPRGPRTYVLWNPEIEDEETGIRASALNNATRAFGDLVADDVATLLFARSRKGTELAYRRALERRPELQDVIAPYRAGYLAEERRAVELRLASGELRGVTTTNALELGIDIGGLDASIVTGFPGTIASFRQQSGRAGRSEAPSLTVLVAGQDALDQYYMAHPDELFARSPEAAVINPDNPTIGASHLECAAHEGALLPEDRRWFGDGYEELVTELVGEGRLGHRAGRVFWSGGRSPASGVDIRGGGGPTYIIRDGDGRLLGSIDEARAYTQCHEGAVYLHQGDSYVVERLDIGQREISAVRRDAAYYTQAHQEKDVIVSSIERTRRIGSITAHVGAVEVASVVVEYRRRDIRTGTLLSTEALTLPERRFRTEAFWFTFPEHVFEEAGVDFRSVPDALHAAEHTAIATLPLHAVCDRWDVGGLSTALHPDTGEPVFFIYDGHAGGTGIAAIGFGAAERHLATTLETLATCPCSDGCPSCVQSPKCGNYNEHLDKDAARRLLATAQA